MHLSHKAAAIDEGNLSTATHTTKWDLFAWEGLLFLV